jgi:oxygen-dependent protoporphyrinogen oxidase
MTVAETPHVVIIGGGIAGLAAAFYLKDEPVRVTVLEGSPRLGGKLWASDVAGVPMDEGAEALLARRPEGIDLITATGLDGDLVPAGTTSSAIFTRGAMRPLPRRQFMGVPADLDELAPRSPAISARGWARRSSTGSSTPCSAASTPAAATSSPSRRRSPRWPPPRKTTRR